MKKYIQTNLLKEIYIPKCKYLLLIVNLKDNFVIDFETVGNKEIHDQIEREVYWLNIEKFLERRKEFHPRLWDGRIKKYFEPSVNDSFGFY